MKIDYKTDYKENVLTNLLNYAVKFTLKICSKYVSYSSLKWEIYNISNRSMWKNMHNINEKTEIEYAFPK